MVGTPHTRDTISGRIAGLMAETEAARRSASLYPDAHPRYQEALESLRVAVAALAADATAVKLTVYKQECFLNDQPPEVPLEVPQGFSDRFLRLGLASVVFPPDVSSTELSGFLRVLSSDTRRAAHKRTLAELAAEHGLGRITLLPLDYGRLFMDGVGRPAEVGERNEEHFARLLTLWDPRSAERQMSDEELEALGRLSEDRASLARLVELSLKGPRPVAHDQAPLVEGTVGALDVLADRLRNLYPERWVSLRKTLVEAALSLDSSILLQRRPELLGTAPRARDRSPTPADEMANGELAVAIVDALAERPELDDGLAVVIRDLLPDSERRLALEPLVASRLVLHGVPEQRRAEVMRWWEERVVRGEGFRGDTDPLFSSLLAEHPQQAQPIAEDLWFREALGEEALRASYVDDLKGLLCFSSTPEEVDLILSTYHGEFLRLAEAGGFDELRRVVQELAAELVSRGYSPHEALGRLLSVALTDHLASAMVALDPGLRAAARETALAFGGQGFRAVMTALARSTDWDVCEELRGEAAKYGPPAEDELVQWLTHTDTRMVREALFILRRDGSGRVIGKVEALLGHRDAEVRAAALATAIRIGGDRRMAAVEQGLLDPAPRVVQVALDACAELGARRVVAGLSALIRGHRDDAEFLAVRGAAIALAGSQRLDSLLEELQEVIRSAGSWTKYTRDEKLVLPSARALLRLDTPKGRAFVARRGRWGVGLAGRACRQALRDEKGAS
ncbi:MAG: hypothetical protein MUE60_08875 [Candidatus Eisenbacteria bacterium]|jgi:hypothetical protein|nr:hypothetical protein [Candidatus Eisenbacteria bacterium]